MVVVRCYQCHESSILCSLFSRYCRAYLLVLLYCVGTRIASSRTSFFCIFFWFMLSLLVLLLVRLMLLNVTVYCTNRNFFLFILTAPIASAATSLGNAVLFRGNVRIRISSESERLSLRARSDLEFSFAGYSLFFCCVTVFFPTETI